MVTEAHARDDGQLDRRLQDLGWGLPLMLTGLLWPSVVLGLAGLVAALSRAWRTDFPVLAICLLLIGASLVARPLFAKTT